MLGNPFAGRELLEQRFVEPSRRAVVDILDGGLAVAQLGATQPDLKAPGVAIGCLAIEQQSQPFGMGEIGSLPLSLQLDEGVGHAVELERLELVKGGMDQHRCVLLNGSNGGHGYWGAQSTARPRQVRAVWLPGCSSGSN